MKGYLSKNPDGRYLISHWRPILLPIFGTETEAFFPMTKLYHAREFGDPLWSERTFCPAVVEAQLKQHGHAILEPGESRDFESLAFLLD